MRVGIVSDTHDRTDSIAAVVALLRQQAIEVVFHCGDIESVRTVGQFVGFQMHFVLGNWDGDWITGVNCGLASRAPDGRKRDATRLRNAVADLGGRLHEPWGDLELEGRQIGWVHGDNRELLKELEQSGCYDFLFYGHTHIAEQHRTGRTLVINPGALFRIYPQSFALLDLQSGTVESVTLR
ncbi:MAG: YfcE family phosphodiesterase [Planctomycetia bacterium]|nr:YfcE family phosphodiesterase [Planctomycetia bacterium]